MNSLQGIRILDLSRVLAGPGRITQVSHRHGKCRAARVAAQQTKRGRAPTQRHNFFGLVGLAGQEQTEPRFIWPNVAPIEGRVASGEQTH